MSDSNGGTFVSRCHTCGETMQNVDQRTAQKFFRDHLDRDHEPELYRVEQPSPERTAKPERSPDGEGSEAGGAAHPD